MKINITNIHKKIGEDQMYNIIKSNWGIINQEWVYHQWNWVNNVYLPFKDHAKYLILIFIIEKTMKFYNQNFIKFDFDEYYKKKYLEVQKFNITEISKNFNLPKETVRRKIKELESMGAIKRIKKSIIIDRSAFFYTKPDEQIKMTSKYISRMTTLLKEKNIMSKKIEADHIQKKIQKNFTLIWSWFYEMQIPWIVSWNSYFKDFISFHIFGTCTFNQICNSKSVKKKNSTNFIDTFNKELLANKDNLPGLSAMSLSEMTLIPRATIIRKCKTLVNKGILKLNNKKQFLLTGFNLNQESIIQRNILKRKAKFLSKTINYLLVS